MAALRIEEDEAVEEGVQKFFDLLTRLEGADLNYSELQKKTKLLALLPESWSSLIINLNRDLPHLSLEDVKRAILQEDFRRRELASADGAGAGSIGRGHGRGRGRGRGGSRFGSNNFNGGRGSTRSSKGVHALPRAAAAVVLERQMAALRIEEDEAVEEGVQKLFDLLTRLEGADLNYSELQKKTKLLALLLESWSLLIINLNRDLPRLSLEDVKRAILEEGFRRCELASADGAGAASIGRGYGRGRGRGRGGDRFGSNNFNGGHGSGGYGSDNKSYGRGRGRFDGECHYCHKSGHMWRDCFKLPDGWTPAQGQEGRGAGGGRGRCRGGRGGRGDGAANMKNGNNESESRGDRFPGQFFFVSMQAPAAPEKDEIFEELVAVGKVTLHSVDYWVIDSGATWTFTRSLWDLHEDRDVYNEMWQIPTFPMLNKLCELGESGAEAKEQHKGEENSKAAAEEEFRESISEATAKAPLDEVVMDVVGPLKLGVAGAEYFLTIVDAYTRMT
ncbi:unnamed protein product [Closterium sp. NIES-53]